MCCHFEGLSIVSILKLILINTVHILKLVTRRSTHHWRLQLPKCRLDY